MNDRVEWVIYRTRGGLLSWTELRLLAEAASARGTGRLYATPHQELVLRGVGFGQAKRLLGQPPDSVLQIWSRTRPVNIMTTAPVAGLEGTTPWLSEGGFRDVLGGFAFTPSRSIALADPVQGLLPIFLAEITFLAMAERDHWRVRVAPGATTEEWSMSGAIRSRDIPEVARLIEAGLQDDQGHGGDALARALAEALDSYRIDAESSTVPMPIQFRTAPQTLSVPIPDDGVRSDFCLDLCVWAKRRPGVSVGLTPWRTLLVRGLSDTDALDLRALMLCRNVAEVGGPWRTFFFDGSDDGSGDWLYRALNLRCPVDLAMSIGIVGPAANAPDVHVLVRENKRARFAFTGPRYDVYRRESGIARSGAWIRVATKIRKRDVPDAAVNAITALTHPSIEPPAVAEESVPSTAYGVHRCRACLTEYDNRFGDPAAAIPPGIDFEALPSSWACPVCSGVKVLYERVNAA